ncbi:MAG: periplasmic nitrate reductase electron transfer subunit [Sneathiella sp.]|uniref:nitrate reductase cytochrome c-type subunit n=1 Tax=Sneathiella sp. TaxID=1964365 RepID=UPI000C5ACC70|nr:nitrate reductase cytochrome c-type subunit [Sneathiella sp.]MAZ03409.1 periplasmic nitrate reductase electron transfer subunit [Sneathiella sp.]
MNIKFFISLFLCGALLVGGIALADGVANLRGGKDIGTEPDAPAVGKIEDKDLKRVRNYPEQPPTIPHDIRDYEVTKNANKCLSCHSRSRTGESQAPMVSVTHFMDRDYQVLATISPRRYFCNQCHVPQMDVKPLIENTFVDVDELLEQETSGND